MENLVVKMEVFQFGEGNSTRKGKIIVAFAGTGKTCCAKKHENVLDFDYLHFKFTYPEEMIKNKTFEELKGVEEGRDINPLWPKNFITQLLENVQKYDVVLVPANDEILDCLEEINLEYILCYPKTECKPIYMKRYLVRGNNQKWIKRIEENFEQFVKDMEARSSKKIILEKNETLEDKLIEMNYIKK